MCQYRRTSLGISLMWYKIIYAIVVIVICVLRPVRLDDTIDMSSDIARLRKDILPTQYRATRLVRPVVSESTSMTLTVTVKISDFISFELDKNEAATQLSMCFSWCAEILAWDPSAYNGLSNITVYTTEIWRPDVDIFNHVDFQVPYFSSTIMFLYANGTVEWCPQVKSLVSCDTDMSHFPHDEHVCVLLIGSSTYTYEELRLEPRLVFDYNPLRKSVRSSNWELKGASLTLVKGSETEDYYDYALQLAIHVSRRFSLHRYGFTLPLFTCAILTFLFCWIPLTNDKRLHLGLLSVVLTMFLMIRYSDTLRHSISTPWGLRFAGDLVLFTCIMITLQILCMALEDCSVPFATHPMIDRFLNTTFISAYVLNERSLLINEEGLGPDAEMDGAAVDPASREDRSSNDPSTSDPKKENESSSGQFQPEITSNNETMQLTCVNQSWQNLLVATMRISVTIFFFSYAFTYYVLY
ncbi:acetylcholine receptor subunit alpha-like isoform X1 [Varroa jacobsoni]|uniref:acetylcholine receptor subunit alpha-like isoform X1 n=1 Tax=Varroa jacobsoni TaxID=62625 RepID=UPI000BF269BF|nr:acetylcholine receptor subunit alpha-like isoform X1 [Varroa jacobsoni]